MSEVLRRGRSLYRWVTNKDWATRSSDEVRDRLLQLGARIGKAGSHADEDGTTLEIDGGPITLIQLVRYKEDDGDKQITLYAIGYEVPDQRIGRDLDGIHIRATVSFGRVRWSSSDIGLGGISTLEQGLGIVGRLEQDEKITSLLTDTRSITVTASSIGKHWTIWTDTKHSLRCGGLAPSRAEWQAYQRIAGQLLAT